MAQWIEVKVRQEKMTETDRQDGQGYRNLSC